MNEAATEGEANTGDVDVRVGEGAKTAAAARALRRTTIVRVSILAGILVVACVVAYAFGWLTIERALGWTLWLRTEMSPVTAAAIFLLLFAGLVAVGFPATPFLVAAGVAFGAFRGTLLNMLGGALAVTAGYWLARTIARDAAKQLLGQRGKTLLARSTSFGSILRLRLLPVIPMSAISYAAGVARVHFLSFLVASVIGTFASAWGYAYLADGIVAGVMGRAAALWRVLIASSVLLVLTILPRLWARRRAVG